MNWIATATSAVERLPLSDRITRAGIGALVSRTAQKLADVPAIVEQEFAEELGEYPIALHVEDANHQHYELPPEFFVHVLGPHRKYSCCYYANPTTTLAEAELEALEQTAAHAGLVDGQSILELGCGWGSLSLWMAQRFPKSPIVSVSNSWVQREFIKAQAAALGIDNLEVVTADMNEFSTVRLFDRVVSVEMFEHMTNWPELLRRIYGWLAPGGKLFLHVFSHRKVPYRFDHHDRADWIAQHFFTGGIMPSHNMIRHIAQPLVLEQDWRWSGTHYERTANHWIENYDANAVAIEAILRDVYGAKWSLWKRRWRLFFLATAELFGAEDGDEWGVSHYLLKKEVTLY